MLGVAQRFLVFAQPGQPRAARGGFEREALAQDAGIGRLGTVGAGAQHPIEEREAGAGSEGRSLGGDGGVGPARPSWKSV